MTNRIASGKNWKLINQDSADALQKLPDSSVDYCCFSIPFISIFVYSNSPRDLGNCKNDAEFYEHYRFIAKELYRVLKPGRLLSVHSMVVPTSKTKDGYIGLKDLPGEIRRMHQELGFIFHSRHEIAKDPVVQMQRTKALGLLHKQLKKDSTMSRAGIPDDLSTFRKPGENKEPVEGTLDEYYGSKVPHTTGDNSKDSINRWQVYANSQWTDIMTKFDEIIPTLTPEQFEVFSQLLVLQSGSEQKAWHDINQSDTLQAKSAKANNDERHLCVLQLDVIRRCLQLWSNPGDLVLDPFNGVGSCGHVALGMGRKYLGIELKESYFKAAVKNLKLASNSDQLSLLESAA
ncbi:MAG: hypothetical protein KME47_10105 [Nodosilinea sp. WJT8-NPBG4]|jgi:hypothetical protein|nr:hypothetical protein [Nodosilinea sp. WJT8-NPBG4]